MASTQTVVAALKFQGGVVIGSDSQVSDPVVQVRWPMDKLYRVPNWPLVVGFSGSSGRGERARAALGDAEFRSTTFERRERVQGRIEEALRPIYAEIAALPQIRDLYNVSLGGLAVFMSGGAPEILECELNGDTGFHQYFHALGSGGQTAYAVFRTLGGSRLEVVDESKALMAMARILRTAINVDFIGVAEPMSLFVVGAEGAKQVTEDALQPLLEAVDEWERQDQDRFFTGTILTGGPQE